MVFFTSDNGSPRAPDGNLPLRGYKTQVWEGGYREPGIVWWRKVKAGVANNKALVATYDIFPTIIALAGDGRRFSEQPREPRAGGFVPPFWL